MKENIVRKPGLQLMYICNTQNTRLVVELRKTARYTNTNTKIPNHQVPRELNVIVDDSGSETNSD